MGKGRRVVFRGKVLAEWWGNERSLRRKVSDRVIR